MAGNKAKDKKDDEDRFPEPGTRRFTKSGAVVVFDGEQWRPDRTLPGDGEGTPIRDDTD